ncbi:MAG: LysR family transcriptional regulator [Desulfofustis sp.]|nr:LysR family transcriptional regulator [Desulfofustis sp.]
MLKNQQIINAHALLEFGSFRKAAHSQNISQSAFSRSISNLEKYLGVELFHRSSTGVTPTIFGEALIKHSKQILVSTKELEREIKILKGVGIGDLSLAMGPYPAELSGNRAVGRILANHPNLRCRVSVTDWFEVEKMVLGKSFDLGLAELGGAVKNRYLETEPIGVHRFVFFCRSGHPLLNKKSVTKADLDQFPLALIKLPERLASVFPGRLFRDQGFDYVIPSVEVQELTLSRQIVAESDAFSAATIIQIENELKSGTFSIIPFEADWMSLNYGFIFLRNRALSPAAIEYMEIVRQIEKKIRIRNQVMLKKYRAAPKH